MAPRFVPSHHLLALLLLHLLAGTSFSTPEPRTYIIRVAGPPPHHTGSHREWHQSFLPNPHSLLYSYRHVLGGFAARLTALELDSVRAMDGFVHAEPSRVLTLDTTHTPSFLGLHYPSPLDPWRRAFNYGRGVVIGLLDTGISPTHPSFHDVGMPPPPPRWRGECKFNLSSLCNNKLIGARSFENGTETSSPFDADGHGTHTASIAAGRFVPNASVLGSASGTAAGIAPEAHVAMYKVCNATTCLDADVIAGIDTAVADGVDVISMSLSGDPVPFYKDPLAIAALGAYKHGVFFAASAGNGGPWSRTVHNNAPWMLTVGASTTDRRIRAVLKLGNGSEFEGESAYQPGDFNSDVYLPLVYPDLFSDANSSTYCTDQASLQRFGVHGKIVLCMDYTIDSVEKSKLVRRAGASGMILMSVKERGYDTYADPHFLPTSHIAYADGLSVIAYINSTSNPTATIEFKGTAIGGSRDPAVSAYSSRGPSKVSPGILKPDIIGPGTNILAAWPDPVGPFPVRSPFNIVSGTSMSCPHLAGVAALLKSAHPDWSSAMIKSAIMTTADVDNPGGRPIEDMFVKAQASVYDIGAGHVNPVRASSPGLVYDAQADDYVAYLCGLNYTDAQVGRIVHERVDCSKHAGTGEADLNYPSFVVSLGSFNNWTRRVRRIVTNVGEAAASYRVRMERPLGVTVRVRPEVLRFGRTGENRGFTVTFGVNGTERLRHVRSAEGLFGWVSSDGKVVARSPVVVRFARTPRH